MRLSANRPAAWPSATAVLSSTSASSASTPSLFRSIPAELMFRYNFVPLEAHDSTLVVAMADPEPVAAHRRAVSAARQTAADQGRHRLADRRPAEAHRAIAARPRPGHRRLHAAGGRRRRRQRRKHLDGEAHARYRREPGRASGRHRDLHGPRAARERHPHRDAQLRSGGEVPH